MGLCRKDTEAAVLDRLLMGSDILEYVEGCGERTAVFLWNYETQRMHGVFSGTAPAGPVSHSSWAACPYKYAVRHSLTVIFWSLIGQSEPKAVHHPKLLLAHGCCIRFM